MTRLIICSVFFICSLGLLAQNDSEMDIIYMKNKEVHKGIIIKNEFGIVSLKVENDAGARILKLQYFDISKIERTKKIDNEILSNEGERGLDVISVFTGTQLANIEPKLSEESLEEVKRSASKRKAVSKDDMLPEPAKTQLPTFSSSSRKGKINEDYFGPIPKRGKERKQKQPRIWVRNIRGFRGFFDVSYNHGIGKDHNSNFQLSKSIGFQFNPLVYLGVGTAYNLALDSESSLPIFFNPRFNMTDRNDWNPFCDIKVGYSPLGAKGLATSTTMGVGFVVGKRRKSSVNVGLSYSYQDAEYDKVPKGSLHKVRSKEKFHNLGLSVGFEY